MKKTAILAALALFFIFYNSAMAADATKVVIVDLQRCMVESNEGKRVTEALKKEITANQQRYIDAQNELAELQKEIEKQSLMLSTEAKASKQNEYKKKNRELGYLEEDLEEDMQTAQQNASQKILKEIYAIIESMGNQQAFDLVFEKSNAGIIFASDTVDITDQVIEELNKVKP